MTVDVSEMSTLLDGLKVWYIDRTADSGRGQVKLCGLRKRVQEVRIDPKIGSWWNGFLPCHLQPGVAWCGGVC